MKIELWAATKYVGSKTKTVIEVDDEEWDDFTDDEKEQYMQDVYQNAELVEWGWNEV